MSQLAKVFCNARLGISTVYGLTETGGALTAASGKMRAENPTTVGRALPVVDLQISEPDVDGSGEILARSPGQMIGYGNHEGYWGVDADSWIRTSHIGRIVDDLLYITGRAKDIITKGGENIFPNQIESVILDHPDVLGVAVFGIPD
jgi:acyl-CoA synthetase (AMP-forming)/AMP-acid ligase II